jgi:hypothetical protein
MCNLSEDAFEMIIIEADMKGVQRRYYPKPISMRDFDWEAWIDPEMRVGYGKTEVEAINNLFD